MKPAFGKKSFYSKSNRHQNECYSTVIDKKPGSDSIAYMEVNGKRESLVYRKCLDSPAVIVAQETYILSPQLAGSLLFWVEQIGDDWLMKRAILKNDSSFETFIIPTAHGARAMSLSCFYDGAITWLSWEERINKQCKIRLAKFTDGELDFISDVTDFTFNAYDPAITVDRDGKIQVVYCAFIEGDYRIMLQTLDQHGTAEGVSKRISNKSGPCVYPSIHQRKDGGIWYSYTHYGATPDELFTQYGQLDYTFVRHFRRKAQNDFYTCYGVINVGIFADGRHWTVPKSFSDGMRGGVTVKDTAVPCTLNSHHSTVFEDENGRAVLLYRQNEDGEKAEFEDDGVHLNEPELKRNPDPWRNYPDLKIITLNNDFWSTPTSLIKRAHFDMPINFNRDGNRIKIGFTEDNRSTGPGNVGEYFDDKGQVGCGLIDFEIEATEALDYNLYPYILTPCHGPSMEEPQVEKTIGQELIAFGQTHIHSFASNCGRYTNKDANLTYRFIQDVQHADFAGITDHVFNMWHTEMLFNRKLAEFYYFPGHFVAISAYEWTGTGNLRREGEGGPFGHMDVLYLEEEGDLEFYTPFDKDCKGSTPEKIWQTFREEEKQIITIPHHMADVWHPFKWEILDTQMAPVVELFQTTRGSYEKPDAPGVNNYESLTGKWCVDWLKKGKKFGFIGGGEHCGMALAGLIVDDLSRSSLYEAFKAKRTFATTGLVAAVNFTCNESPMGSTILCDKAASFEIKVNTAEAIHELQIVRNGEEYKQLPVNGLELEHTWQAEALPEEEFWYCRVIFKNNEILWTSPIWIKTGKEN